MTDQNKKVIIGFLAVIVIGLAIVWYLDHNKQSKSIDTLTEEKEQIISELDSLTLVYNVAINEKTELSNELEIQRDNIIRFRDSLKKIKKTNWKLISFYKNKIKGLTTTTDRLLVVNDSLFKRNNLLNLENQDLNVQKDSLTSDLKKQNNYNDTLAKQNLNLAKKVAIGEVVKINNYSVTTYDERKNGKYKVSSRARRVNIFKVSFLINDNPIAKNKDISAFVTIKMPNGEVLSKKGLFTTTDDKSLPYSDETIIPYKKKAIATDIIINADTKLEKGVYSIIVYIDNRQVAVLSKTLN